MFKNLNIKGIAVIFIAIFLSVILAMQVFLYAFLRKNAQETTDAILQSVAKNTVEQIEALYTDIEEYTTLLAGNSLIQKCLYEFSVSEIIHNITDARFITETYRSKIQNNSTLAVFKENKPFVISELNETYNFVYPKLKGLIPQEVTKKTFLPSVTCNGHTYFAYIVPISPINFSYSLNSSPGNFLLYIFEMENIDFAFYDFLENSALEMMITNKNGDILLSPRIDEHGKNISEIIDQEYYILPLKSTDWNIHIFNLTKGSSVLYDNSKLILIFMIVFDVIIVIFFALILKSIIIKRFNLLKKNIICAPLHDSSHRISYNYSDEFSEIIDVVNQFLAKIQTLSIEKTNNLQRIYDAQLMQKETQIYYLNNQISPHFLYNSMSYIQALAIQYNAEEIVYLAASFAKLFRYYSNNTDFSTVHTDLEMATNYFNIINNRRNNPIKLVYRVDSSVYDEKCLKMIFQPIIENILKHAYTSADSGTIIIESIPDDKKVIIEITDDGKGISKSDLFDLREKLKASIQSKITNSDSIGLINVHSRLVLYYGKESGIEIISEEGKGTRIRIIFNKELL